MHSPSSQRESRHVLVTGLPDNVSEDRINSYFSNYGGVQSVDRNSDGIVISFTDIRSARKANNGDHRLDNMSFRMSFHDPAVPSSKNSTTCMTNRSSTSPRAPTTMPPRKRSISPWKEFDEKSLEEKMKYRMQRPLNVSIPKRNSYSRKDGRGSTSPVLRSPRPGLQGFYIENLPRGQTSVLNSIHAYFNSHGTIADTHIEELNGADDRRALLIFNNLTKPVDKYAMIMGQKCRVRAADAVDVQVAYNKTVAAKGAMAASLNRDAVSSKGPDMYTVYYEKASRTLYVGNLDSNPTEASLRRRYGQFGTILEIDVKNPESPSPFAFLHYADLDSTVRAVNAFQHRDMNVGGFTKKPKVNFGRSQPSNKLWIGNIPPAATEEFFKQRMKMLFEGITEIVFDSVVHQAILRFDTLAHSSETYSNVRTKNVVLKSDGQDYRLSVDYATEGQLNYFKERVETRPATTSAAAQPTTTAYLSPPPIPPVDMPGRYDDRRRSPPRGYRRSRSREHTRRRSRSTSRKRERKREKRRGRSSSNDSSSSDSASDSRTSTSSSSNDDRRNRRGNHDRRRRRSRNRDRRSDSRSQERDDVRKKVEKIAIEQPQERAASGDSGSRFEEARALEPPPAPPAIEKASPPPPAPPSGAGPQLHKLPPPQAPPRLPQYTQPPPPLPIPQLPPPIKERPKEHQQPHPAQPGTSREPTQEKPREARDGQRPREERQRMPGERIHHHDMLTKRPSYDEKRRSDADVSAERKLEDGRIIKPGRPCNRLRDFTLEHDPIIPTMPVNPAHHYPDPRKAAPYHPFQYKLSIVPFQLSEHEQRMKDLEEKRREVRAFKEQMGHVADPEARKKSSGSVHSVDVRRASGGSFSRVESQEEPNTPIYDSFPRHDENARMKQRSDSISTPTWTSTSGAVKLTIHEPVTPYPQPGQIQSRSISIEDRLSKLRRLNQDSSKTPIKLGLDTQSFGMALNNQNAPGPRPNLHINIPPTGVNFPTTPNSAKSDFSPKVDSTRRMPSTAIPTSSTRQPFTPTAIPPPSHMESQASPLLSAPPPPPLLPRLDSTPSLKSPPMTPGSVSRFQPGQTPSPSFTSRPVDFKQQAPPTTPRSAFPRPPMPPLEKKESRFGSPNQFPPKDKLQPQRHDSMSAMRSPPAGMPARSMSVSDSKKPQKDTSDYLQHLFNKDKPNTAFAAMKLGKIGKKADQNAAPSETVKEKEHKKHKEHKLRKKEDGTYETKEERAKRKELKRLAKAALEKRDKKLEKKKSKEKEEKEKSKKHKKERKEKESKKDRSVEKDKKKKKKRKQSGSEESDSESDLEVFNKSVIKDQNYSSDAALAALIGQSMYDRVKRRSSAPKDEEKKRALQALKDKKQKKKRLLLSSSEDDDDASQKRDSDQSSEESETKKSDSESEKEDKNQKKREKEAKKVSSESDSEEEVPKTAIKKPKKEKNKKRDSLFSNSDIFGANSSDDEEIRPPPSRKSKTSTSDESDHHKKHQKIDYVSLFGTDSVDEKREKRDKQSPSQSKHRKRQPSSNHDETQAKKSKRGSLSSDVSAVSGVLDHRKSRESSLRREEAMDESHLPTEPREEEQRPRLVTKAAMKVFEPLPATSQMQHLSDEDSDDSETAAMPPSQPLSSSSESEVDSMSHVTSHEEHETVVEESSQDSLVLEPPPAPPATFEPAAALSAPPAVVQYEPPMFQAEPPVAVVEEPIRDLEGELAAQAIADDQDMAPGQSSIFDDCEEPIPEYPSHDFIRTEETVLIDPVPVAISEEQVLSESFAEEPLHEEDEEEEPIQHPIHTLRRVSHEFPSPTSLAAHAVAVKSPLSVAVDSSQMQTPQRAPVASTIFSPTAHSHSSNEPLTSPVRSTTTPMSSMHQSPLVSPTTNQPLMRHPEAFTQNFRPQMDFYRQQQANQQVPLQAAHQQQSPVHHLNGTASGLDQHGLAAVPSPSHALSGTSSISSPGTPPSFGKKMPPVWKGRIAIKNTAEITVQMHYMFGQKEYGLNALSTLSRGLGANRDPTMRIGQRMKAEGESLYRLLNRLQSAGTTCLCVPVGNNPEEVQQHARILKNEFAHYFVRKGCAGVASLDYSPKSFVYVFPPNEFTDKFLAHSSPDLFSRIQHKLNEDFSYLFVAIAPQTISDQ